MEPIRDYLVKNGVDINAAYNSPSDGEAYLKFKYYLNKYEEESKDSKRKINSIIYDAENKSRCYKVVTIYVKYDTYRFEEVKEKDYRPKRKTRAVFFSDEEVFFTAKYVSASDTSLFYILLQRECKCMRTTDVHQCYFQCENVGDLQNSLRNVCAHVNAKNLE